MKPNRSNRKRLYNKYKGQNRLLRCLSNLFPVFNLPGFDVEFLDAHIFPGNVDSSGTMHVHDFVEVHIPIEGAGDLIVDNKKYKFCPGKFIVTGPQQIHHWVATESPLIAHIWWIKVTQNQNEPEHDVALLMDAFMSAKGFVYTLPESYMLMYNQLIDELNKTKLAYSQITINLLHNILIVLIRSMIKKRQIKSTETLSSIDEQNRIVGLVDNFLKDNLGSQIVLEDLAKQVRLSKRSVTRHYKVLTGKTIGEKLSEMRLYKAEELVRETDLQVKNIAYTCGFRHASHFAKQFEKFFGYTPSGYRKKIEKEKFTEKVLKINKI